jgi:hypothetical protein
MKTDEFEKRLQRQPLRQVPAKWRDEILLAARQTANSREATHNPQEAVPSLLSTLRHQLRSLLWPHPAAWAGLAAVWLLIMGLNLTTGGGSAQLARQAAPASPQVFLAYQEQARVLAELIGPREAPVAERPKPVLPRPRSEGGQGWGLA